MPDYVIPPPAIVAVPVQGGGVFPVRRVFCVGRNYAAHTREMGGDPNREAPFFFMKPADALLTMGEDMPYPPATADLHHEMELVVAIGPYPIGKGGSGQGGGVDITEAAALDHVWGYAAGLDMTRRDLQGQAKKDGKPWDMGKGFDHAAPIGALRPASAGGHPNTGRIVLKANGQLRQSGDLAQMIWSVPETISFLSRLVRLVPGDLIFTGTPDGVAAVQRGDLLEGEIEGVGPVHTRIV